MPLIPLQDVNDARVAEYRGIPDPALLRSIGVFIAEGRLVVRRLLTASPFGVRSVLVTEAALQSIADLLPSHPDLPVYVAPQNALNEIAGFNIHRGCLAAGSRPPARSVSDVLARHAVARAIVLESVSNADNVGGIFRSAAALGGDAVIVGPGCADPLYRKAIRTSMGATLHVPFCFGGDWQACLATLRGAGFLIVALTPAADARDIDESSAELRRAVKAALLVGAEFNGLSAAALEAADWRVRIPVDARVDSLNVSVAAGIALHALRPLGTKIARSTKIANLP
jgi:tRNA G18 (ribose-2'-O)-methylase SpoU